MKLHLGLTIAGWVLSVCWASGQVVNAGFGNWKTVTTQFSYEPFVSADTFDVEQPNGWTTSNTVTLHRQMGQKSFVERYTDSLSGVTGLRMVTDSLSVQLNGGAPLGLTLPGFLANGEFTINLGDLLLSGRGLSPTSLRGAGQPYTKKALKLKARVKYIPNAGDSLLVWAVLKKKDAIVGEARILDNTAYADFTWLEANFTYTGCEQPDTLVILAASSFPDFTSLISGNSGLVPGSILILDSLAIEDLPSGFKFPPIALDDKPFTSKNKKITVEVLANDNDCNGLPLSIVSVTAPRNGTATITGNKRSIEYTPALDFAGLDTFFYTLSNSVETATARVEMSVFSLSHLDSEGSVSPVLRVFPNPATTGSIQVSAPGLAHLAGIRFFDSLGRVVHVAQSTLESGGVSLNLADVPNGVYHIQVLLNNRFYHQSIVVNR
jgi:hypothetical protein